MEKQINDIRPESHSSRRMGASLLSQRKGLLTPCAGVKTKQLAAISEFSRSSGWVLNWNNGNTNNYNRNNAMRVRPVSASLWNVKKQPCTKSACADIPLEDVFAAYYNCRKNKRNTPSALAFEVNYEENCVELWQEIYARAYQPRRSIAFIVTRPVKREIFAADFRDRIVHHLIASRIEPMFEAEFIAETSNCRKGKGTHYGIRTLYENIYACSEAYTVDCWVLKLDIKSFFMSISKHDLLRRLTDFVQSRYVGEDKESLLYLIETTILNDPRENCVCRSPPRMWRGMPKGKSLFTCQDGKGIPIGNLTSQLEANFFLNEMDHWLKDEFQYYGRYVDDFYLLSRDVSKLREAIQWIRVYLNGIGLTLHPDKVYLQHYSKGVKFIGAVLKPRRIYIANRTRSNFLRTICRYNHLAETEGYVEANAEQFCASMNSYLGLCKHYATYGLRRRMMKRVSCRWWKVAYISGHFEKIAIKNRYKKKNLIINKVES